MIRALIRFLWRRDSESATCLIIEASTYLNVKDTVDMSLYLKYSAEYERKRGSDDER